MFMARIGTIVFLGALIISSPAFASDGKLIKTCSITISAPGIDRSVPTKFEIFDNNGELSATTTQIVEGNTSSYDETAQVSEFSVRADLSSIDSTKDEELEELNLAEMLIIGTSSLL